MFSSVAGSEFGLSSGICNKVGEVSGYLIMCQSPRSVVLHLGQDFREVSYF